MNDLGRTLIVIGLLIAAVGVVVGIIRPDGLPRLPGDIYVRREGMVFYFPLGWCVLISVILSLIFWLAGKW